MIFRQLGLLGLFLLAACALAPAVPVFAAIPTLTAVPSTPTQDPADTAIAK